ncbi:Aste57867_1678 [Aphanomyces stellatus]|uniref:Aste57867_1678 protein n=1 Tax=Aphanomyces stellatus TaxID=120398 RepID=A0A485KA10_9STRA|nr:hypothetical protein As57867_001676 [Aphanomyces stellatus]VFT78889.1 Aste57867_1678 [Aphanomyces stellatus]
MVKVLTATVTLTTAAVAAASFGSLQSFPADVMARLDASVDPCDDFYQYSCGTWFKNTAISPTSGRAGMIAMLFEKGYDVAKEVLKTRRPKLSDFVDSCMDTKTLESLGLEPIAEDLEAIRTANSTAKLIQLSAQLAKRGTPAFTKPTVDIDEENPNAMVLWAEQGELTLDRVWYMDPNRWNFVLPAYKRYVTTLLKLAGKTDAQANAAFDTISAFERRLAGVQLSVVQAREAFAAGPQPVTFAQAAAQFPLTVGSFFDEFGMDTGAGWSGPSNKVILSSLEYFANAEALLASQPRDTIAAVMEFRVLHFSAKYLAPAFKTANWQLFGQVLKGQQKETPRDTFCIDEATDLIGEVLGEYFLKATFNTTTADFADKMVKNIEKSFEVGLDKSDWLDDVTRKNAKTKLSKFTHIIGGSKDPELYPTVQFDRKAFLQTRQQIVNMNLDKDIGKIGKKPRKDQLGMAPSVVNAFYHPLYNEIFFPAGILQAPFFDGSFDPAQNYGAIGMVMGHEVTHGFDVMGRNFDGDGFQGAGWWTAQADEAFTKRVQCIQDQYSAFEVFSDVTPGKKIGNVDGRLTLPETIADNGGLKSSFRAWQEYMKTATTPYDKETAEKLFFVAYAQKDCAKNSDGFMSYQLTDVHPPSRFRVWGAVQNNNEFARVFKCPANSKMNPTKKCLLWE